MTRKPRLASAAVAAARAEFPYWREPPEPAAMPRSYLTVTVKDVATTVQFYRDAFGIRLNHYWSEDGVEFAQLDVGQTVLCLRPIEWARRNMTWREPPALPDDCVPYMRLSIPTTDLTIVIRTAAGFGAVLIDEHTTRLEHVACLRDPDGFLIELRSKFDAPETL